MAGSATSRGRRLATAIVFVLGVLATAATSPPSTTIGLTAQRGTLELDPEHRAAFARIVVRLGAEATSTTVYPRVTVHVDGVRTRGGASLGAGTTRVRSIVTSFAPRTPAGEPPPATRGPEPTRWQSEVRGLLDLPLQCGPGPCERAFWLIAQLDDAAADAVVVDWQVTGSLQFTGDTWPSGASATITLDPPVRIAGPVPSLVAASDPDPLVLGPRHPAAARIVAVRIGADAVRSDAGSLATMSVALTRRDASGGDPSRRPIVSIYPLAAVEDGSGAAPDPAAAPGDVSPFEGCQPGAPCERRFLVTVEWIGGATDDETFDLTATVRRLDLIDAWSTTAELSAAIVRRFDVDEAAGPAGSAHVEGEAIVPAPDREPQVAIGLRAATTASDPIARLLPAPAVVTYRSEIVGTDPSATAGPRRPSIAMRIPGSGASRVPILDATFQANAITLVTNPLAGCRVGATCPDVTIQTFAYPADTPPIRVRWTADVTLFAFAEAPLSLSAADHSPASP